LPETGLGELVAVQALGVDRLAAGIGGAQVAGGQQREHGAIDGVTRPAERRVFEFVAYFRAFLAGADVGQDFLADRVFVGFLAVANHFQCFGIAFTRFFNNLAPVFMVGCVEIAVEAHDGSLGGLGETFG